jgi:MFS family permease
MQTDDRRTARQNAHRYLLGMTASFLGGSAMILAAGIWVKDLTASSSLAALVSVCIYAPSLLGPLAGLVADAVPRRRLLVWVNAVTAAALLLLLAVRSERDVWLIFVVMSCYGVALVLVDPAEQALFAVMLPDDERQRINGLRMSLQEGGKLVAPLAGAGVFSLLGGAAVAALAAVGFGVAALAIATLRVAELSPPTLSRGWRREVTSGFAHVWSEPALRLVSISAAVAVLVSGVGVAAQFSLVDALGRSPSFLGVVMAALGAGSIIAGILSGPFIGRLGETRLLELGLVNAFVGYACMATGLLPIVLTGAFVLGFALPWCVIAVVNLGQRSTPLALQGRVGAATSMMLFAPQPLSQLSGAAAVQVVDYRVLYSVAAALAAVNLACVVLAGGQRAAGTGDGPPVESEQAD